MKHRKLEPAKFYIFQKTRDDYEQKGADLVNLSTLLSTIKQYYPYQVHDHRPTPGGYTLQTNYGPKIVTLVQDQTYLHWAFLWREELAKKGFRFIDRFIRTRDEAPFVSISPYQLVVRDALTEPLFSPIPHPEAKELYRPIGQIMGLMFQTAEALDQKYATHPEFSSWKHKKRVEHSLMPEERFVQLKKDLVTAKETIFLQLVKSNWRLIEQRWKHTVFLFRQRQSEFMPPIEPRLQYFYLYQDKLLCYFAEEFTLSMGLRGVAQFIQEIFFQNNGRLLELQGFLEGFEESFPLTKQQHFEILAWFIYPDRFFKIIDDYKKQVKSEESCVQEWIDLCQLQSDLDHLQHWYAAKIDRLREDAVSV